MGEQRTIFEAPVSKVIINNYGQPSNGESRTDSITVKLTDSEKQKIKDLCFQHDLSSSEFLRTAGIFFSEFITDAHKLMKYRTAVKGMLEGLP